MTTAPCSPTRQSGVLAWIRRHPDIVFALSLVLVMRVWFAVWGAAVILSHGAPIVPGSPAVYHGISPVPDDGLGLLIAPWQRFDTLWYLRIAAYGYSQADATPAFFPLFPVLMRSLGVMFGQNDLLAGLIVNTLATLCAFILLYRLVAPWADPATAERALILWVTFPTGFYLFSGYAEPLLVALTLASLTFARDRRAWAAGLAGAGAALARPVGFLVVIPLAIEAWRAGKTLRERVAALAPLSLILVALAAWTLYLQVSFGDGLLWANAQKTWDTVVVFPGQTIWLAMEGLLTGKAFLGNTVLNLGLTIVVFAAVLAGLKRLPLSFSVFALAMLVIPLLTYFPVSPLSDAGRRTLVIFPAFIALAQWLSIKWPFYLWITVSAILQAGLFVGFVLWIWVD